MQATGVVALDDVEHECFGFGHVYGDATAVKTAVFLDGGRMRGWPVVRAVQYAVPGRR